MSTDDDYASFLDKANQPTSKPSKSADSKFASTKSVTASVPAPLKSLSSDAFYTSDTDEPFEPVALEHDGEELDDQVFQGLIGHDSEVESMAVKEWNVRGQYDDVVKLVEKCAGDKEGVKVFRVGHGSTRCEYYVVVLAKGGDVVGVKAKAVES